MAALLSARCSSETQTPGHGWTDRHRERLIVRERACECEQREEERLLEIEEEWRAKYNSGRRRKRAQAAKVTDSSRTVVCVCECLCVCVCVCVLYVFVERMKALQKNQGRTDQMLGAMADILTSLAIPSQQWVSGSSCFYRVHSVKS